MTSRKSPPPKKTVTSLHKHRQLKGGLIPSEKELRAIFAAMDDVVLVINREGVYTGVAPTNPSLLLKPIDELLGTDLRDHFSPEQAAVFLSTIRQVLDAQKPAHIEYELQIGGRPLWFSASVLPMDKNSTLWMVRDITERKQAEAALLESEERYHSLFEHMMDGVYRSTHAGRFVDINPAMVKMFGYSSREEMLEVDIKNELYFAPEERGSHVLDTGQEEVEAYRMRRKDGSEIWVEDHGSYVHDQQGGLKYHEGILRDITERKKAEEDLRIAEANYRSIYQNATVGIYQSTPGGVFLSVNPVMAHIFGYDSPQDMVESIVSIEKQYYVDPATRHRFERLMKEQGQAREFASRNYRKDGGQIWVQEDARAVKDEHGNIKYYEGFVTDITERKRAEDELRSAKDSLEIAHRELKGLLDHAQVLARTDGLTGLFNFRHFYELATYEFGAALRYKRPLSIIIFDIDNLKVVNDTHGHIAGDRMLITVAKTASLQVRGVDALARYGGDEFVILLPQTNAQQAFPVAERIRASVEELSFESDKGPFTVTLSIGISDLRMDPLDDSVEKIVQRADSALYSAKQDGRNRTVIFQAES
jgi:diguanylate cyclase (GGDEF)-like protein/PAS domain S-box-containing protein